MCSALESLKKFAYTTQSDPYYRPAQNYNEIRGINVQSVQEGQNFFFFCWLLIFFLFASA